MHALIAGPCLAWAPSIKTTLPCLGGGGGGGGVGSLYEDKCQNQSFKSEAPNQSNGMVYPFRQMLGLPYLSGCDGCGLGVGWCVLCETIGGALGDLERCAETLFFKAHVSLNPTPYTLNPEP